MDIGIECPHCRQLDLVQSVPALHADGVSTSSETNVYSGVGVASTGLLPVYGIATVERTNTTALARSLAREPARRPVGRLTTLGLLLLLPALFAVVIGVASVATSDNPETTNLGILAGAALLVGGIAAPGLLVLGVAAFRGRRNGRISRGRRTAHAVWHAAFYCHRCGVAFWPMSPAPAIPGRQAFAPQHFRWLVWNAGGYANI
ncbi:hypothetical protein AB0B25_07625 [Nocardia sp. NPDC049190]|uniref:hypothetical protein n=1 Tax=Nocardia sp. NPDC049190 TaxID=3155650 RepID=UPI0033E70400